MDTGTTLAIPVLLGSARDGRRSDLAARFVAEHLGRRSGITAGLLDLAALDFPIMRERMSEADPPPPGLRDFATTLQRADGLLIVAPEYKGGYPGVLKNALDYLDPGIFRRKPIGIVTVSAGDFGGLSCLAQLRLVCLSMGGLPIPAAFPISRVETAFDPEGRPLDPKLPTRLGPFLDDLIWYVQATTLRRREDAKQAPTG